MSDTSAISEQEIIVRSNLKSMINIDINKIKSEYKMWLRSGLCNERSRRLWAGIKANIIMGAQIRYFYVKNPMQILYISRIYNICIRF